MRIPLPQPVDLATAPALAALSLLEVALVLTADVLRPGACPPWADPGGSDDDPDSITARVLAHECLHLRRLLASYRRRLLKTVRRHQQCLDNVF